MQKKIYLDCTHTYNSGLKTGIQRVVKNIVKHIPQVQEDLNMQIIPVVSKNDTYFKFDTFPEIKDKKNIIKVILKNFYIKFRSMLSYILPKTMSEMLYTPKVNVFLSTQVDKFLFAKKIDNINQVTLNSDDTLILMDAIWLHNDYKKFQKLKKNRIKIIAIVYDMIPISHPQFCTVDLTNFLKDWYQNATEYIDGYIAISKSVQAEVHNYIKENIKPDIGYEKFDYFYLGSQFENKNIEGNISLSFQEIFTQNNTYLSVSTIEPRKNYEYTLDTFEKLWKDGFDVKYVIIGRIGWKVESLIERIKSHKEYNKKLFLLNNVNDTELVYAYKNAKALIFASYIEGFGLPIIESLFYKLPVLASDIAVHREIGQERINYFDLSDSNSLLSIIKNKKIKNVASFFWQNWEKSTKELILKSEVFNINDKSS